MVRAWTAKKRPSTRVSPPAHSLSGFPMAILRAFIIAGLILAAVGTGNAGPLQVSAYITSSGSCSISSVQNIAFGNLNPLNPTDVQATGNVRVLCWGWSSNFTVGVTQVSPSPRFLISGPNSIPYTLDLPTSATRSLFLLGTINIPINAHIQGSDY